MPEEKEPVVMVGHEDGVATITLNRPKHLNALNPPLFYAIGAPFRNVAAPPAVRAVVLTGAGRAFCAGADVSEDIGDKVVDVDPMAWRAWHEKVSETIRAAYDIEKPVIAAINGVCYGGGCDLAMACDFRIASSEARFSIAY